MLTIPSHRVCGVKFAHCGTVVAPFGLVRWASASGQPACRFAPMRETSTNPHIPLTLCVCTIRQSLADFSDFHAIALPYTYIAIHNRNVNSSPQCIDQSENAQKHILHTTLGSAVLWRARALVCVCLCVRFIKFCCTEDLNSFVSFCSVCAARLSFSLSFSCVRSFVHSHARTLIERFFAPFR